MLTALRRRRSWAVIASVAAHLGVLAAVLSQHPTLVIPTESAGPPEPIIPVLIMPRTPPPPAGQGVRPAPIQLHQRSLHDTPAAPPVAPVVLAAPKAAPAPIQGPVAVAPKEAPQQAPAPPDAVRNLLRATLGCADARLSRDERAGCQERLGRGARDAPYLAPALSPEKRAMLEQAGTAKMAQKLAAERALPGAVPVTGKAEPQDYSGEPDVATNAVPAHSHPPSKRAAKVLGPLPP
jgi:hypothetical protein